MWNNAGVPDPDPLLARVPSFAIDPVPILAGPSPVVQDDDLGPGVWVKRDDLIGASGLPGGSKLRKLAYILAGHDGRPLSTIGPIGSNWLIAAIAVCRARRWPLSVHPFRVHAYPGIGAKERWMVEHATRRSAPSSVAVAVLRALYDGARGARILPPGGSGAWGALAMAAAALELADQVARGVMPAPTAIYVPYGSGGTAVGLALGCELAGTATQVRAVRVNTRAIANPGVAAAIARAAWRALGRPEREVGRILAQRIAWRHGQFGGEYARPTLAGRAATARATGFALDPAYGAKTLAALLADRAAGDRSPVVFWNTYGALDA